ncbi:hypothetical protein [Ralstonia insidiosa]|uniref:Uncharacterized protein n=1 Tax=Ralstonia insidiosa TaxID=190721 RepID=A0A848P2J6_9RALS|nr:hypothetical protein [Ralstonia insidiosa]NMV41961.1 hypothetical protein [Ralstonia insidiosa]
MSGKLPDISHSRMNLFCIERLGQLSPLISRTNEKQELTGPAAAAQEKGACAVRVEAIGAAPNTIDTVELAGRFLSQAIPKIEDKSNEAIGNVGVCVDSRVCVRNESWRKSSKR